MGVELKQPAAVDDTVIVHRDENGLRAVSGLTDEKRQALSEFLISDRNAPCPYVAFYRNESEGELTRIWVKDTAAQEDLLKRLHQIGIRSEDVEVFLISKLDALSKMLFMGNSLDYSELRYDAVQVVTFEGDTAKGQRLVAFVNFDQVTKHANLIDPIPVHHDLTRERTRQEVDAALLRCGQSLIPNNGRWAEVAEFNAINVVRWLRLASNECRSVEPWIKELGAEPFNGAVLGLYEVVVLDRSVKGRHYRHREKQAALSALVNHSSPLARELSVHLVHRPDETRHQQEVLLNIFDLACSGSQAALELIVEEFPKLFDPAHPNATSAQWRKVIRVVAEGITEKIKRFSRRGTIDETADRLDGVARAISGSDIMRA